MNEPVRTPGDGEVPPVHPLEIPFIWFGIQFVELAFLTLVLRFALPRDWPWGVDVGIWSVLLAGLTLINYKVRRRFIPR